VPPLLWERADNIAVSSTNVDRVVAFHAALAEDERGALEQELLSQLDRESQYADVAYFIFLVLYRLGRGFDALNAAQQNLRGDAANSYSNVLGLFGGPNLPRAFFNKQSDARGLGCSCRSGRRRVSPSGENKFGSSAEHWLSGRSSHRYRAQWERITSMIIGVTNVPRAVTSAARA
jgi:hypothetical protein